jgi:Tfp pilus assembly protein PilN
VANLPQGAEGKRMTPHGEKQEPRKLLTSILIPLVAALISFALGTVRADSAHETELQDIRLDVQKIRAMPDPSQVVTKDQLTEIVRRLDERTEQISQDVQYLRQHEEKRAK